MTLTFVLVARGAKQIHGLQAPIEVCCNSILEVKVKLMRSRKTDNTEIREEDYGFN